jgi:hypothetical protein
MNDLEGSYIYRLLLMQINSQIWLERAKYGGAISLVFGERVLDT